MPISSVPKHPQMPQLINSICVQKIIKVLLDAIYLLIMVCKYKVNCILDTSREIHHAKIMECDIYKHKGLEHFYITASHLSNVNHSLYNNLLY